MIHWDIIIALILGSTAPVIIILNAVKMVRGSYIARQEKDAAVIAKLLEVNDHLLKEIAELKGQQ